MANCERPDRAARRAFTLIELLVVISIIVALAAVGVGVGQAVRAKGRWDRTRMLIDRISTALNDYESTVGRWPDAIADSEAATNYPQLATVLLGLEAVKPSEVGDDGGAFQGVVLDAWKRHVRVRRNGNNSPGLDIWSVGVDPADPGDDVVNWGRE